MTRIRTLGIGVICLVPLAACASGGSQTPAPSSTPTSAVATSQAPTPSPVEMSVSQAGQVYLAAVCSRNAASQAVADQVDGKTAAQIQLATLHAAAAQGERVNLASAATLESPPAQWPTAVRAGIAGVITIMRDDAKVDHDLAAATTAAAAEKVWDKHPAPSAAQLATVASVRTALSLPTKQGSTAGCPSPAPSSS
jgi:hypothetical protein